MVAVVLGGIGAAAGFTHTHDWAVHHGQTGWLAWADAIVIEGMVVVAGFEVHRDHRQPPRRRGVSVPTAVLVAGFGIQMAAQVALAEPTPAGWLLAAMPALGFLIVVKLQLRHTPIETEPTTAIPSAAPSGSTPQHHQSPPQPQPRQSTTGPVTGAPKMKLPPQWADSIDDAVAQARNEGREITIDDIRRVLRVPEKMAARILADLTSHNGQPTT